MTAQVPPEGESSENDVSLQWPGALPRNKVKRLAKVWLGRLVSRLAPGKAERVRQGAMDMSPTLAQRLMLAAWVHRCETNQDLGALAPLHRWLWASQGAARHHEEMARRFERWWADGHHQILDAIADQYDPGVFTELCEIGCGTGQAIRKFADRFPALRQLTGWDLSPQQIESNQATAFPDRIHFVCADALDWLPKHARPGTIYLTIDGVYEYLSKAELERLFAALAQHSPAMVALVEPIPADFDFARERESRPYNDERSLGHHYPSILEEAGFEITWKTEVVDELRWCLLTAVTKPDGTRSSAS